MRPMPKISRAKYRLVPSAPAASAFGPSHPIRMTSVVIKRMLGEVGQDQRPAQSQHGSQFAPPGAFFAVVLAEGHHGAAFVPESLPKCHRVANN